MILDAYRKTTESRSTRLHDPKRAHMFSLIPLRVFETLMFEITLFPAELISHRGSMKIAAAINTSPRTEKRANTLPLLYAPPMYSFISVFIDGNLEHHYHYRHYSDIDVRD